MRLVAAADNFSNNMCLSLNHCVHNHWVLDYTVSNGGLARTDHTAWEKRQAGVGHLYPPGCVYHEDTRSLSSLHSLWILFDGEYPHLRQLTGNDAGFARILDPSRKLQSILSELAASAVKGNLAYWEACAFFCKIQDMLGTLELSGQDAYTYEFKAMRSIETKISSYVRQYLEERFRGKISLKTIARKLGISESGLSHRYKTETGESIFETLLRIRLEQSLPLLRRGERQKTIAAAVGFSNEFYYSRCFRLLYGQSPGAWCKNRRIIG